MQDIYDDLTSDPPLDEPTLDSQLDDLTSGSLLEDSFAVPISSLYQSVLPPLDWTQNVSLLVHIGLT